MKEKRKNPYQMLMEDIKEFARKVRFRNTINMWHYPKAKLDTGWNLTDLWERTSAAEQLGYDVVLEANENGLTVKYVKKIPHVPMNWQ